MQHPHDATGPADESHAESLRADALMEEDVAWSHTVDGERDGDQYDRSERAALRRVAGLSTELEDVTEVEYRQLRLERVVLVGVWTSGTAEDADRSLAELAALAETAGALVLDGVVQRRDKPDPATYIGSGKAQELYDIVRDSGADTVVCDGELSPGQLIHLEDVVKVKVVDRTALILDIFAQHAKSREGKAQVSLAQMQYMLPRLRGWGQSLSRQMGGGGTSGGGGMATRGPGETKIETDRRRIREKMAKMRREIAAMKTGRELKRQERRRNKVPSVAIAGYTNAGKSTLLNTLTGAGVLAAAAGLRGAGIPCGRGLAWTALLTAGVALTAGVDPDSCANKGAGGMGAIDWPRTSPPRFPLQRIGSVSPSTLDVSSPALLAFFPALLALQALPTSSMIRGFLAAISCSAPLWATDELLSISGMACNTCGLCHVKSSRKLFASFSHELVTLLYVIRLLRALRDDEDSGVASLDLLLFAPTLATLLMP